MEIKELNDFYKLLDDRANEIVSSFLKTHGGFKHTIGYYNGHYSKDDDGNYKLDYYPIPVISVFNICDIEINLYNTSLSTKLKRKNALAFDYSKLKDYDFEVYGVDDYLDDYYVKGNSIESLMKNLRESKEENIGFAFSFDKNIDGEQILKFIIFLSFNGFFY